MQAKENFRYCHSVEADFCSIFVFNVPRRRQLLPESVDCV